MGHKLTLLIPCKNERQNIRPCIESGQEIADEILVADSGSTDGTLDVVKDIGGCRIIEREYHYSASFKNWAIPQASNEWVMVLDADERITPQLAAEIRMVLENPSPELDGYWIGYQCFFMGHPVKHSRWGTDSIRLFRRDQGRYCNRLVHAELELDRSRVGHLKGELLHYSYWTFSEYIQKYDRYTTWGAQELHKKGRKATLYDLSLRPMLTFLHRYFVKRGCLDGLTGLQLCMLQAYYASFMKYGKLWELDNGIPQPDPEEGRLANVLAFPRATELQPTESRRAAA